MGIYSFGMPSPSKTCFLTIKINSDFIVKGLKVLSLFAIGLLTYKRLDNGYKVKFQHSGQTLRGYQQESQFATKVYVFRLIPYLQHASFNYGIMLLHVLCDCPTSMLHTPQASISVVFLFEHKYFYILGKNHPDISLAYSQHS